MTDKIKKVEKTNNGKKVALTADFGTFFIRINENEIMRPVRADMTLYEKMGHFFKMRDDFPISHPGYKHLNKVASVNIVTPQKVMIDERERLNPHIERNPKTKMVETVAIRKIGIGYSPAGNITVIDKTLFYNLYAYFIESVQSKMKKEEWKWDKDEKKSKPTGKKLHPDCAVIGTENEKPKKEGSWAFFETISPLGLWINHEDSAIIDCLNEHTQRQKFGDRIAQTIVERNILKDHPAIGIDKVYPTDSSAGRKATVTVYGYRHEFGYAQVNNILAQAEKGQETIDVKAEVIDTVELEEEEKVMEEVAAEDPGTKKKKKKKAPEKTPAEMEEPPDEFYLGQEGEGDDGSS